jgi:copper chaperone CopZ
MKFQLVFFTGCPNVEPARAALRDALVAENLDTAIEEIDVVAPGAPAWARGWGSPTILINGKDLAGQLPSSAPACRLYQGGAPSVREIRDRIAAEHGAKAQRATTLSMIGAISAAIAASACCVVPPILAIIGISGAGFGSALTPYRPFFLAGTALALGLGFWFAYRRTKDACGCDIPSSRRTARVALWIAAAITLAIAGYPALTGSSARAGDTHEPAAATLRLKVTGMDCAACAAPIAKRIRKIPGVVSATVDYQTGVAVIRHDGRDGIATASIAAVKAAGFRAEAQP